MSWRRRNRPQPDAGIHHHGQTNLVRIIESQGGFVWYVREFSGEAKYDHYLEHFASEHPCETPLTEREYWRMREEYDRKHPNTSCCC